MDFMYDFLMFQHGNHDTNEKLEYYQDFIMTLLGELKTLRETMCISCQERCASSKTTRSGNQSFAISKDSTIAMRPMRPSNIDISTSPRMPETEEFWRTTPAPDSSYMPANMTVASVSSSLVEIPTDRNKPSNESNDRIFYAERGALADTTIDVSFVHTFLHNCVHCVRFSPDGRYLAVGTGTNNKDGSIVIYEVESHKKYCELREYASQYGSYTRPPIESLCFSSNGKYLAVEDDAGRIIIWDVRKKRIRSIFHGSSAEALEVRLSSDGRLVALRTDAGLTVLNMRDNPRRMVFEANCFDFSPGGRLIATGNDDDLVILDVHTGKAVKRWNGNGGYLYCVEFTSDGRGLLGAYKNLIEQWDVSDVAPVLIRKSDVQFIYFFHTSVSPDHRLLAAENELWDVKSGKRQYTLRGHNHDISFVDFSAGGTYLAMGSWDAFVSLWKCS